MAAETTVKTVSRGALRGPIAALVDRVRNLPVNLEAGEYAAAIDAECVVFFDAIRSNDGPALDSDEFRDRHERAIRDHILGEMPDGSRDSRADGHHCDDLCSEAIIDRLIGQRPKHEYPLQPQYAPRRPDEASIAEIAAGIEEMGTGGTPAFIRGYNRGFDDAWEQRGDPAQAVAEGWEDLTQSGREFGIGLVEGQRWSGMGTQVIFRIGRIEAEVRTGIYVPVNGGDG